MAREYVTTEITATERIANATRALRTLSHMDVVYQEALEVDYIWEVRGQRGGFYTKEMPLAAPGRACALVPKIPEHARE